MKKILSQFLFWWKKIIRPVGIIQSRLLFLIIYLIIFLPIGIIMSFFSDPLLLKAKKPTWKKRSENYDSLESLKQQ